MPAVLNRFTCRRAAVLAAAFATLTPFAGPARADEPVSAAVDTVRVQRAPISQQVRAYGVVATSSASVTSVNLPYTARIRKVLVLPGQTVARGAPLVVVQADPAAVLAASQASSGLTLARGELARTRALLDDGLATQSQLAAAQKALDDAQQGQAAQRLMGVRNGDVTIAAPFAGVVSQLSALPGDQVQAGATIAQLAATGGASSRQANVTLGVEPSAAASIHAGDTVVLHGLSTALAHAAPAGQVIVAGASIDPQSQLVDVGANVPLGGTAFIPGTRVSADIATQTGTWWVVPRAAVLRDTKGAYVFQVTPKHAAHRVDVAVRVESGDRYGVDGPLNASEPLVVTGNYELQDGMTVRSAGGTHP
ncbi:efflux transporter periplasmic adaptor subunit [Burkholderia pyrrocinia]|uniref:Efflux transporter periplasmic adaptor subunit n=1 Tax=Burkholderia pyrrocinia TaxID=60550 RepID=A0A2Z5N5P2_BURPY|nr:efflux RND transporter periplasmic adaptor subunit [Burkholderia pyrrocinia]AXF24883.1 efflux transporter periplasmic adaptor subunit [Burkholderia pyrrocinia]